MAGRAKQPPVSATGATARQTAVAKAIRRSVDSVSGRPIKSPFETRKHFNHRVLRWKRQNNLLPGGARVEKTPPPICTSARSASERAKPERRERSRKTPTRATGKKRGPTKRVDVEQVDRFVHKTAMKPSGRISRSGLARLNKATRIIRNLPYGIGYLSDVALAFEGRFRLWQHPQLRELFDQTADVFRNRYFAFCGAVHVVAHSTVGPNFGLADVHRICGLESFRELAGDLDQDLVKSVWLSYDGSLTYRQVHTALVNLGPVVLWVPLYRFALNDLGMRTMWVCETMLEVGARFCFPLGVALTVYDILRAVPEVARVFAARAKVHINLMDVAEKSRERHSGPVLVQEARRIRRLHSDGSVTLEDSIQERVELGQSSIGANAVRVAATGLGTVVGVPVAIGVGLAGIGAAAGLTLAATPFYAGYAAYKASKGESVWKPWQGVGSTQAYRTGERPAQSTVPPHRRVAGRPYNRNSTEIEVEELETDGVSESQDQ